MTTMQASGAPAFDLVAEQLRPGRWRLEFSGTFLVVNAKTEREAWTRWRRPAAGVEVQREEARRYALA